MTDIELKKAIDQGIKEAYLQGVQSGKKETSGLVADIMSKIEEKKFNGLENAPQYKQVIKMLGEQTDAMKEHFDKVDHHIEKDTEWKADVTPSIAIMKKMQGFTSTGGWILKGVLLIAGATSAAYGFLMVFKHFLFDTK